MAMVGSALFGGFVLADSLILNLPFLAVTTVSALACHVSVKNLTWSLVI